MVGVLEALREVEGMQPDAEKALQYCHDQIRWYRRAADRARIGCHTMEILAIVLSGAVPVVLLIGRIHPVIPAALSAAAAMLVAINTTLGWRANWARYAHTAGLLEAERMRFEMRADERYGTGVSSEQALDRFVEGVTSIVLSETTEWRALAIQPTGQGGDKSAKQG